MAKWQNAKKPAGGGVERFSLSKDLKAGEKIKLRIVGDFVARYQYWIKNDEDKFRTVDCLSFDPETEQFVDDFKDAIKGTPSPRNAKEDIKAEFAYAIQAFKEDGTLVVIELKKGAFADIVGLAQDPDWGNPADTENGYSVSLTKTKTGPLPQNIEYGAVPSPDKGPLTTAQQEVKLHDLNKLYKRLTYDEQCTWLRENTNILNDLGEEDDLPEGLDGFNQ